MSTYQIAVVTRVPSVEESGNMAAPLVYGLDPSLTMHVITQGRSQVFILGELLILNESGREPFGHGRKPSKWNIDIELFDDLDAAIARAEAVAEEVEI